MKKQTKKLLMLLMACSMSAVTVFASGCGFTKKLKQLRCEHVWDEGEVTIEATCTENGEKTFTCTECKDTKTEEIAALGHVAEVIPEVPATCTENGTTESKYCKTCEEVFVAPEVIPATGHNIVDGVCSNCQYIIEDKSSVTLYLESSDTASLKDQILAEAMEAELFDTFTVEKVVDVADSSQRNLLLSSDWIKSVDDEDTNRERTLVLYGDNIEYKVNVMVVTKVITTADELANLIDYANNKTVISSKLNDDTRQTYSYDGYFVLGGNITADETTSTIQGPAIGSAGDNLLININSWAWIKDTNDSDAMGKMGFHGTFDGLGYKVDGFKYAIGGLFGVIGSNAVIKNVAFTNCIVDSDGDANTRCGGVLAHAAHGGCSSTKWTIDNVYVQGAVDTIWGSLLLGRYSEQGNLTNAVLEMKTNDGYTIGLISAEKSTATITYTNVVAVYDGSGTRKHNDALVYADTVTNTYAGVTEYALQTDGTLKKITGKAANCSHVASVTTEESATTDTFSEFDAAYWTLTAGKAPIFKSVN